MSIILLIVSGFAIVYLLRHDKESERYFKQGIKLYENSKYSDAYYNFSKVKKMSELHKLALIKQFQAANKLNDIQTKQQKLALLVNQKFSPDIRAYILYNDLLINENTGKYSKDGLYKRYLYIYTKFPKTDFAKASCIKLAKLLEESKPIDAKGFYIEYLSFAPNGKYSQLAFERLKVLNQHLSISDKEIIAKAYMDNADYKNAYQYLKELSFENHWYDLAVCLRKTGNFALEKDILLRGLDLSVTSVNEKDIAFAIDRLVSLFNGDKVLILQNMYTKYYGKKSHPTVTYKLAESLTSIRSIKLYEYMVDKYRDSIWAPNSLWEVFWYNYKQRRYPVCIKLANIYRAKYSQEKDMPRLLYWQARAYAIERNYKLAKENYVGIINKYPINYYAFMSARQLKYSKAERIINKKQIQEYNIDNLIKNLTIKDKTMSCLFRFADFTTIDELKINDPIIKSWILNKKEKYFDSIKQMTDILGDGEFITYNDYRLKIAYPVVYAKLINNYALEYNVSPYILLSLIRQESHFNKNAKSPVGAVGLSQIMPATARHIEGSGISEATLLNEEENIRIGAKYLSFLLDKYDSNVYYAIMAYNAGFGNVNKWLNDSDIYSSDIDEFIENIPFFETKNYIKNILASYWVYQNIYSIKNK